MERSRSTLSLDRQKSTMGSRSNISAMDRQKSTMGSRSSITPRTARSGSAQLGRTSAQPGKAGSSGRTLEYPCTACESEGKTVEATNFCADCAENLCADCVKQHQKFPAMKTHRILGKSERKKGEATPAVNPLECSHHPGKEVEMYCEDHDEIYCGACIAVDHRKCPNTMLLDKAAKGIIQSDDVQYVKDNIKLVKKNIGALKKKTDTNLNKLEKQKTTVLNRIKTYRQKLDQALNKLEEATVKELEQAAERAKIYGEDDKKLYAGMISTLDAVLNMVVKTKGKDVSEAAIFVGVKRAKQKILESERIINFTKNSGLQEALRFMPDTRIIGWLKSLKQLGTFAHQQRSYSGALIGKYNVHTKKDSGSCDVFGCDMLPDGRLILTDWDNRNVKILNTDYGVVDQCSVLGCPLDICCINPEQAVVSLTMQKKLQFISINTTLTATNTVATEEHCRGIAYHDGQIFVLCGGFKRETEACVCVFGTTGELLNTIKTNNVNQRIFTSPIAIAIDADGMFYHITDGQRGVITLIPPNDVVSVVSCKEVAWPCGICMDREGNALICNGKSNTVIQMSTLSKFNTVLTYEDGVKNPHAVCFDPNNLRLIVTGKGNNIAVYQLAARGISDVAKDVKATVQNIETAQKAAEEVPKKGSEKATESEKATKSEDKSATETMTELPKQDAESNKTEDKAVENTPRKKKTSNGKDDKKTPAFTTMTQKLLLSQQEVTKANTSPENRQRTEENNDKSPQVTEKKSESALPSLRLSKEKTTINKPSPKPSKEDSKPNLASSKNKSGSSTNLQSPKQVKEGSVTSSENKSSIDGTSANKTSKRPLTESQSSLRKRANSQIFDNKGGFKRTQTTVNSISLRSKDKEGSAAKSPNATTMLANPEINKDLNTRKTEQIEVSTNKSNGNAEAISNIEQPKDVKSDPIEDSANKPDEKSETAHSQSGKQGKSRKETLATQNRRSNTSMVSLRSKVIPSPQPSSKGSTSTRGSRKSGPTGRKT